MFAVTSNMYATQVSAQLKIQNNSNAMMHVEMSKELSSKATFEGNTVYDIQPGKVQKVIVLIDYGATGDVQVKVDAQCKFNASIGAVVWELISSGGKHLANFKTEVGCNFAANASAFATLGISQLTSLVANVSFTKSDGLHECSLSEGYINIYPRSSNQVGIDYHIPDTLGGLSMDAKQVKIIH
ncbi:hypothetical protein [Francisella tularensis]|uniref:hypothetical protein n=1 Tax=Francisella tularensis TaxID=263 RepID=UPI0005A57AA9|nr:hypothetical protein [Francisella tularensis]AJI67671.1 hypothetical protein CH68_441 [Francisella tularensis subsp. holarctica]AKO69539.1 hypothetical protein AAX59_08345 [Francisella tularensis subsp. holarctica]AUP76105.1 hypothetical protein CYL81_02105 [Francisella tularensis]AZP08960.1 hypothetical protein EGX27_06345 [Francisella tularensis]KXO24581.1 hypothetical protein IU42_08445 [Francisella tularensis]